MKKHLFVLLIPAAVAGIGLFALAADPPVKPMPPKVESEQALDGAAVSNSQAPMVIASNGEPCDPRTGMGCSAEFAQTSRGPADHYSRMDPAFSKYVELSLLTTAMSSPDASGLADVAFGLAEGERVLARTHRSGLTAEGLMARVVKLAGRTNDKATLDRITKAATAANKPQWAKLVTEAKEFGGTSRDGHMLAIGKIDVATFTLMEAVRKACNIAGLTGQKWELERLTKEVADSPVDAVVKAHLSEMIGGCSKGMREKPDDLDDVLDDFVSSSRDGGAVSGMVVAYVAGECAKLGRQAATGWTIKYPKLNPNGDLQVTFRNEFKAFFGSQKVWIDVCGNIHKGNFKVCEVRGPGDFDKKLIKETLNALPNAFNEAAPRIAREVKRLMDNGPPPPLPDSGPRVGQLMVKNNYDVYVTVRLFHPASPDRVFAEWPIPLTLEQRLLFNHQDMYIGSDWQIQVVFGNGATSPKRLVGQVGSYQQGMFRVAASDIYNGR